MSKKVLSRRKFIWHSGSIATAAGLSIPAKVFVKVFGNGLSEIKTINRPTFTDLFISGEGGYPRYRITALEVTNSGVLLAFTQGRQLKGGDNSQNDLVIRRSLDGGSTWLPMQVIAEDGNRALTPHCSVIDHNTGRIIVIVGSFPDGCHAGCVEAGYEGENVLRLYQLHSDNDGETWSEMINVTPMFKRPAPFVVGRCGSGMGIQLRHEPYAGRLIMPVNNRYDRGGSEVCAVYSDDGGESWQKGNFASKQLIDSGPGETQMVELEDGTIMLNARARTYRKIAHSTDGGENWTALRNESQLVDSGCNASIIRYSDPLDGERSRILFSNPASQSRRENGKIRLSYDEGKTWAVEKVIYPNKEKVIYPNNFGYSSMARLPDGDIGMIFERDRIQRSIWTAVTFVKFSMAWLTDGKDPGER